MPQRLRHLVMTTALSVAALCAAPAIAADEETSVAPEVQRWEAREGAPVYFVQTSEVPMVDIAVVFDAGSARDGDTPGLARLTARSLDQGVNELDASELARRLEDTGAQLSASVDRNQSRIHLRSLTAEEPLSQATALLRRVLASPTFSDEAVARELRRMRQALRTERQSAARTAERALYQAMYGDHPYATAPAGTEESLASLSPEQVARFHATHYVAANAGIAIVGDLAREKAETLANRLLDALPAGEPAPPLPQPSTEVAEEEVRIDFPGTQTVIMMGQPAIARGEEALEYPLRVANQVLGGSGLVSRLFQAMREERGLSYSTASRLQVAPVRGPWLVHTSVETQRSEEALAVLREEVNRLNREGLSAEEIHEAVRHLTGSFPLALASNASLIRQLSVMAAHRLPADHLAHYVPRMEAVDPTAVREALDTRLHPEQMATVIVGPQAEEKEE